MIDGIDGLAGKMVLISTLGVSVIFYLTGTLESLPLTHALLGVVSGFLLFNSRIFFRRAWVFMGDSGSMWLGLVLGWLLIQATTHNAMTTVEPSLALWLFGIPLLDTLGVIFRRVKRSNSPFHGDRSHIHHLLEDRGFSFKYITFILCGAQISLISAGIFFHLFHAPAWLIFWSFVLLIAIYCYSLRDH
jgi:UDP-GlcNAc:undecaprenyl-phosphate GlcNAc-1-phosphate transferase